MSDKAHVNMIPCLQYRDGHAAIEWLCRAFGLEKHAVHDGPDGTVTHAELRLGSAFVMLGSNTDRSDKFNLKSPLDSGSLMSYGSAGPGRSPQSRKSRRCSDCPRAQRHRLRLARIQHPRSGGPFLALRHLSAGMTLAANRG